MKPADIKLSMASAGTLLSFTFHWSSGTYSTWSSTNWTHIKNGQHTSVCIFASLPPLLWFSKRTVPCNWPVFRPQDVSLTHKTAPSPVRRVAENHTRRFVCSQKASFIGVWRRQLLGNNLVHSNTDWNFFYESASAGCSGADDDKTLQRESSTSSLLSPGVVLKVASANAGRFSLISARAPTQTERRMYCSSKVF